jgi:CRP/FNR family transcriptional regulator
VLAPSKRNERPLPAGHPCQGCEVRYKAVCGVLGCVDLAKFKNLGQTLTLAPGQALFHAGDAATRTFTLTKGTLKLYKLLADGRRQIAEFLYPGEVLGAGVEDEHAFTAEALERCQLCWFPRSRFDEFVNHHTSMERELYRVTAHELAAAREQLVLLGRKTASERIASFLLRLSGRVKLRPGNDGAIVTLRMSRSDIADYLGLTKETVSRVLSAFRRERIIRSLAVDELEILSRDRLEQCAEAAA